jgi:transcriptional regulator with XRE-family HTH domain
MCGEIFSRLRQERVRLRFTNQADFAAAAGVSPSSVHNYEAGKRSPDAEFLAKVATLGVDVLYVLTGEQNVGGLSPKESALLDHFRNMPEALKQNLAEMAAALSTPVSGRKAGNG